MDRWVPMAVRPAPVSLFLRGSSAQGENALGNLLRYICMGLGAALLIAGWLIISSQHVRREAIDDVGGFVAARMLEGSAGQAHGAPDVGAQTARRLSRREVILQAATTTYAGGIACMILGAGLLGFGLPSPTRAGERTTTESLRTKPGLLMLGGAGFLLLGGLLLAAMKGFEGGGDFFGSRSAIVLACCGFLAVFMRRVPVIGLAGYWAGLLATGLIVLNLARLASRASLHGEFANGQTLLLILLALGGAVAFIVIWRAIPGGLDRARLMGQLRRVAAGAGAAAIITGLCVLKSSVLPRQAAAGLADQAAAPEATDAAGGQLNNQERTEKSLEQAHTGGDQPDADPAPIADADSAGLAPQVRSKAEPSDRRPPSRADGEEDAIIESAPDRPIDVMDLLSKLSTADLQKLLDAADIDVVATDPRLRRQIGEFCARFTLDHPRVQSMFRQVLDEMDAERIIASQASDTTAESGNRKGRSGRAARPARSMGDEPPIPQKDLARITPPKMEYLIKATRPGAKADSKTPNPARPRPLSGRAPGLEPPTDSPASREIMNKVASAKEDQAASVNPMSAIIEEAKIALEPERLAIAPPPEAPAVEPTEAEPAQSAQVTPDAPDTAGQATPATSPADLDRITSVGAIDTFIERTTLAADRIGLLAVAIGAATVLAAVLLRRFHHHKPQAAGAYSERQ